MCVESVDHFPKHPKTDVFVNVYLFLTVGMQCQLPSSLNIRVDAGHQHHAFAYYNLWL